jgi:hypothetical protein
LHRYGEGFEGSGARGPQHLRIAKKARQYDEKDPYVPPYDPYGPGEFREFIDEAPAAPAETVTRDAAEQYPP